MPPPVYVRDTSHDSVAPLREISQSSVAMLPKEMPEMTAAVALAVRNVPPIGDSTPTPCTSSAVPLAPFHALLEQYPGLVESRFGVHPGADASERLKAREEMQVPLGDTVMVNWR